MLKDYFLKNRQTFIPGILLGLIAAFFIWRSLQLQDSFHISMAALYVILTVLTFSGKLKGGWRSNALNLGIALLFLDLVFAGLPMKEVGAALATANLWMIFPAMAALGCHLVVRIWRWQILLKPIGDIPFGPAFRAGMIGIGGNMVLPAKAGEFLRAYVIGRSCNISKSGAFATLVVERIFDGLTVLSFLILLVLIGVQDPQLRPFAVAGVVFYLVALAGVVFFMLRRQWFEALIERFLPAQLAQRVLDLAMGFASGLESLQNARRLGLVAFLSIITWTFIILSFQPILAAFDYGVPLPWYASVLMVPMVALGLTIPGAPAGVGPFQWFGLLAMTVSFQVAGTPLETPQQLAIAAAAVVLVHITQAVPEALLGLWAFFREGLTTGDIQAGQKI